MSQPPEYPGRQRLERMATRGGGGAYEGAFEAVGAILIATLLGYWFDQHYETEPAGLLVGAVVGFAAFVLRLVRLGKRLHPDPQSGTVTSGVGASGAERRGDAPQASGASERQTGEAPGTGLGLSDVLKEDDDDAGR